MLLISLLLIPVWTIVIALYVMTLYNFSTTGEFETVMILLTLVSSIMLSYIIPLTLAKSFKEKKMPIMFEIEDKIISIGGYISFIYLLIFGISLMVSGIIAKNNFMYILAGIAIIVVFIYLTYLIIKKEEIELELSTIEVLSENVFLLSFVNDKNEIYDYYTTDDKFKEKKKYTVKTNKFLKKVYSIKKNDKKGEK